MIQIFTASNIRFTLKNQAKINFKLNYEIYFKENCFLQINVFTLTYKFQLTKAKKIKIK